MASAVAAAQAKANEVADADEKAAALEAAKKLGEPQALRHLREQMAPLVKEGLATHIWNHRLAKRLPKFLYFDEYYQMEGQVNIDALKVRQSENTLNPSDHPMLGLIALADLEIDQIINSQNTQEKRTPIDPRWTLCPVGGLDKAPTFIALFRSQEGLKIATLLDLQKKDRFEEAFRALNALL